MQSFPYDKPFQSLKMLGHEQAARYVQDVSLKRSCIVSPQCAVDIMLLTSSVEPDHG